MKKDDKNDKAYMCMYPKNPEGKLNVDIDKVHSPLKILSQGDMIRKFAKGEKIWPIHVRIGLTSGCNMRCEFCNFHSQNEEQFYDSFNYNDKLSLEDTIKFLKEFAKNHGKAITFCGSGECTTHPNYVEICEQANALGLKIGLITNGTMLHKKNIRECIAKTHTWVRIGMNAGTAESFSQITSYKPEGFEKIFNSIRYFKDNSVESDFRIGVNFVITLKNYEEMILAAKLARDGGADYIRFEPEFYTGLGHEIIAGELDKIEKKLVEVKQVEREGFEVSIPKLDRGRMTTTSDIEGDFCKCHYSKFVTALGAEGYIYPCPQVHLGSKYRIANAMEKGYEEVVNGDYYEQWTEQFKREDYCKTCFYRPQNELLNWVLEGKIDVESVLNEYEEDFPTTMHSLFI